MTKRKRDIFTVIESINNWFDASDQYTKSTTDHEGVPIGTEHKGDALTGLTVNGWAAECSKLGNNEGVGSEVNHVSSAYSNSSDGLGVRSEVAKGAATCPPCDSQLAAGSGDAAMPKEGQGVNKGEEGLVGGYE